MTSALRKKLWADFKSLKSQTLTIAILTMSGVSLLVAAWSAYWSLTGALAHYYEEYRFGDVFCEVTSVPRERVRSLERIPGVTGVAGRLVWDGLVHLEGRSQPALGRFVAVPAGRQPELNQIYLRRGRLPEESSPREAVIHESFAVANHLALNSEIQVTIQGKRERLRVVGVGISPEFIYALSPLAPLPDDKNFGIFWLTEKSLETLAGRSGEINSLLIETEAHANTRDIVEAVDREMKPYGGRGAYDRTRQQSHMFVADEIRQQKGSAIYSPAIFLSVAAYLVHVVISRLLAVHRSQIAALKALGYTNQEVARHYSELILLMMLTGAVLGVTGGGWLGSLMAKSYEGFFRFPRLDFSLSFGAVGVGLLAGLIPGLLGAYRSLRDVVKLSPAEALRPPSPQIFQGRALNQWSFWQKMPAWRRMFFRNLAHRPQRIVGSLLGMSVALALVIMSGSWKDLLDHLMDQQFQYVQREDMRLQFLRPISTAQLNEVERLPGVLRAEGYRTRPVRIRFGPLKREMALTGWPPVAELRQSLDREGQRLSVPSSGLRLSQFFREKWGVQVGDIVDLEFLDEASQSRPIVVAGFSEDQMGLQAALPLSELARLGHESPSVNEVLVKTDLAARAELFVKFKNSPQVAGIFLKESLYRGLRDTMGQMMWISMVILIGFSLSIILGVIYNTVRVSYSERSWELASLRVLGFSEKKVMSLLSDEVGAQLVICILPGCLMGYFLMKGLLGALETEFFEFPLTIEVRTYAWAVISLVLSYGLSLWGVRRIVKKLSLVEALKARD